MQMAFPAESDDPGPWFAPLHLVAEVVAGQHDWRLFDPDDFMCMGRVVRRSRPDIYLYKHIDTRQYLNLDEQGVPYRYCVPAEGAAGEGRYVRHRSLTRALFWLRLWELPSMRPELRGQPDEEGDRGRLRLV
jgi:hypothetical protein